MVSHYVRSSVDGRELAIGVSHIAVDQCVRTSGLISANAGRQLGRSELQQRGSSPALLGAPWIINAVQQVADDSRDRGCCGSAGIADLGQLRRPGPDRPTAMVIHAPQLR